MPLTTSVPARKLEDIKFYFTVVATTYSTDHSFESILQKYKGIELDLKDKMRFAPVVLKNSAWVHAIEPQPPAQNWPMVSQHLPFKLEGIEGHYILEFTGIIMTKTAAFSTDGSCTNFDEIFTKLIAPRNVRLKKVLSSEKADGVNRLNIARF